MVCQPGTIFYISVISRPELTSAHEEVTTTCLDVHVKQLWYNTVTIIQYQLVCMYKLYTYYKMSYITV